MAAPQKYFGTDGIRGRAGEGKLSKESIARLGLALGQYLSGRSPSASVVIGRDTRRSGLWIEHVLIEGLTAHGINVTRLGVLPTAATSYLTLSEGASLGIMVTASHNPAHDNGLKLFGPDGRKFGDDIQQEIEALLSQDLAVPTGANTGEITEAFDHHQDYITAVLSSLDPKLSFSDISVVLDCANGAAVKTAPALISQLGLKSAHIIGDQPSGDNINLGCGSTHPERLCKSVRRRGADIGIALDGDADRLILCDETGAVIDGDQIMGALTLEWQKDGRLALPALVATVMSNLGLDRLMQSNGLELIRTPVGDRHVAAAMTEGGYNLGGEQSGHMLMPDYLPTGDGMLAAIQILSILARRGKPASETLRVFKAAPQLLINVAYTGESPLNKSVVKDAIEAAIEEFGQNGRVLIRASGTEPKIRVMAEGDDAAQVEMIAQRLANVIKAAS